MRYAWAALAVLALVLLTGCKLALPPAPVALPPAAVDIAVVTGLKHTVQFFGPKCTSVDLGYGRMVTAKHCVKDLAVGAKTGIGMITLISTDRDFALLVNQEWVKHEPPAMRLPRLGEHVYAVGFPIQLDTKEQALTVTDGIVCGPSDKAGNLRTSAPIYYGNSGGGLWAEDGSLLGITVNLVVDKQAMSYFVSTEDILEAL